MRGQSWASFQAVRLAARPRRKAVGLAGFRALSELPKKYQTSACTATPTSPKDTARANIACYVLLAVSYNTCRSSPAVPGCSRSLVLNFCSPSSIYPLFHLVAKAASFVLVSFICSSCCSLFSLVSTVLTLLMLLLLIIRSLHIRARRTLAAQTILLPSPARRTRIRGSGPRIFGRRGHLHGMSTREALQCSDGFLVRLHSLVIDRMVRGVEVGKIAG